MQETCLNLLCVDCNPGFLEKLHLISNKKPFSLFIETAISRLASRREFNREAYDLCFLGLSDEDSEGQQDCLAELSERYLAPIVVVAERDSSSFRELLRIASVVDVISADSLDEASIERCLRYALPSAQARELISRRTRIGRFVNSVSARLINMEWVDIPRGIEGELRLIADFAGADRCFLGLVSEDEATIETFYEWHADGIGPQKSHFEGGPVALFSWVLSQAKTEGIVRIPKVSELPGDAKLEQRYLGEAGNKSVLILPLVVRGALVGLFGLGSVKQERFWDTETQELLKTLGVMFANLLERVRTERALRASKERWLSLVENAPELIMLIRRDGAIQFLNRNSGALRVDAVKGKSIYSCFPFDCQRQLRTCLEEVFALGKPRGFEACGTAFGNGGNSYECRLGPVFRGERVASAILIAIDMTERQELSRQLNHALRMEAMGRLAGGMAHDFNNLLTAITGYSSILLSKLSAQDSGHREVHQIRKACKRAAALTGQLLTFSRKQPVKQRTFRLNDIVEETQEILNRLIGEDVMLITELSSDLPPICADPGQVQQIVINLAINSRDAMPEGGRLVIKTRSIVVGGVPFDEHRKLRPGQYVELSVSDSGVGMSEDVKRHLFEPFFTTKPKNKGTGLGLSTVYGIVKQSRGEIAVESSPGQGSVFRIYLPVAKEEAQEAVSQAVQLSLPCGSETVLLAEDEEAVRKLLSSVLRRNGYVVLEAVDGVDAEEVFLRYPGRIDLVVADVVMPRRSGGELVRCLLEFAPSLKVVFMSGYAEGDIFSGVPQAANSAYLKKPFSPEEFLETVRQVLDNGVSNGIVSELLADGLAEGVEVQNR